MKIKLAPAVLVLLVTAIAGPVLAEGIADGEGGQYTPSHYFRTRWTPPMSAGQISCTLKKAGINPQQAEESGEALFQALKEMNFPSSRFDKTSLLHFLAQIKDESGAGAALIQQGNVSASKRGFGAIQVTGPDNLAAASKCMNRVDPPSGNGVANNPAGTLGASTYKSMLGSLCWWEMNFVANEKRAQISMRTDAQAVDDVHEIVNGGHVGAQTTGGKAEELKRQASFTKILNGERQCQGDFVAML